jgi:plasmid maintenance system antidote protein VapI
MPLKHKSIVEQLRHATQHSGETEYAVTKGSGVSQSLVNRFVNGERSISIETASKLCEYLRLDLHRRK